ncbi:dienelactone hydrolase family protein [Egicoccus sp. AB-alg2]|uniref:dienelactone hydrolase family protein n=1 Tax=Egicoccus sp. AB-alg2 TaxID=3242693 RepID=UPI00359E4BD2
MALEAHTTEVSIPVVGGALYGDWSVPAAPAGVVVFAHGSGSSRFSRRNQLVAAVLQQVGFATLLMDLLTPAEEDVDRVTRGFRFDIPLLADRVVASIDWLRDDEVFRPGRVGLFGASTGAAAALVAAAQRPSAVGAVVSRGGRPDLAGPALRRVRAPTLLIVGERDRTVLALNQQARAEMSAPVELDVVAGATHLFEEPGALERVATLARDHFTAWLV